MPVTSKSAGTSKACTNCRKRRKRCDLRNPCQRCVSTQVPCSGPVQGSVFINNDGNSLTERSHRSALQHAIARRSHANDDIQITRADTSMSLKMNHSSSTTRSLSPACIPESLNNVVPIRQYYISLLRHFQRTPFAAVQEGQSVCNGVIVYSNVAICMQTVVSLASSSSPLPKDLHCLDLAIFSLLNLYIGKMCRDDKSQVDLAKRSCTATLREFRRQLKRYDLDTGTEQTRQLRGQKLFCLCLALILFELVDGHGLTSNLDRHVDGALDILRLHGPDMLDSTIMQQAFRAFRGLAFSSAARRRRGLFLDEPQWLNAAYCGKSKQQLECLYDMALKLPRLLQRTDLIKNPLHPAPSTKDAGLLVDDEIKLLQDYADLEFQLRQWQQQQLLEKQIGITDQSTDSQHRPSVDQGFSGGILHLATMLLELDMGVNDLLSMLRKTSGQSYETQSSQGVSDLASIVANSISHLTQHNEGQLIAAVPLDTLERYHARIMETKSQESV